MTNALPPTALSNPLGDASPLFHIVQGKRRAQVSPAVIEQNPTKLRPPDIGSARVDWGWGANAMKGLNTNLRTFLVDNADRASEKQYSAPAAI